MKLKYVDKGTVINFAPYFEMSEYLWWKCFKQDQEKLFQKAKNY